MAELSWTGVMVFHKHTSRQDTLTTTFFKMEGNTCLECMVFGILQQFYITLLYHVFHCDT